MNAFFEFFIERLLWAWLPVYAFYRIVRDILEDDLEKRQSN